MLSFRNKNRPARRYLYLRFIMTFLHCKSEGKSTEWVEQSDVGKTAWHTPEKSLRQSFLLRLARQVSHDPLPEELYRESTFTESATKDAKRDEEEEVMAMNLALRLSENLTSAKAREMGDRKQYDTDAEDNDERDDGDDDEDSQGFLG